MAKIGEIINRVDEMRPNAFSTEQKLRWIASLDGRIAADVMLMSIEDIRDLQYRYPEDLESEPLVTFPHDDMYDMWLAAQIDLTNGEFDRYQNDMLMYNEYYDNFVLWFISTYEPGQGYKRRELEWIAAE